MGNNLTTQSNDNSINYNLNNTFLANNFKKSLEDYKEIYNGKFINPLLVSACCATNTTQNNNNIISTTAKNINNVIPISLPIVNNITKCSAISNDLNIDNYECLNKLYLGYNISKDTTLVCNNLGSTFVSGVNGPICDKFMINKCSRVQSHLN